MKVSRCLKNFKNWKVVGNEVEFFTPSSRSVTEIISGLLEVSIQCKIPVYLAPRSRPKQDWIQSKDIPEK